jgi:hypothetical protein
LCVIALTDNNQRTLYRNVANGSKCIIQIDV